MPFRDREQAGQRLAERLSQYRSEQPLVLGLPRGGVPVAYEVARALGAPLDVLVVRKLGVPGREELAMGALARGGAVVLNDDVVATFGVASAAIEAAAEAARREVERREHAYRAGRPALRVAGRTVAVVDDGLATGASMRAAVQVLRRLGVARVTVAVPVAPPSTCRVLEAEADEVVCLFTPDPFYGVGLWYDDFTATTDEEVCDLLARAAEQADAAEWHPSRGPAPSTPDDSR